jgi:hypothetical protein
MARGFCIQMQNAEPRTIYRMPWENGTDFVQTIDTGGWAGGIHAKSVYDEVPVRVLRSIERGPNLGAARLR